MDADNRKRMMPTVFPSFFKLAFRVIYVCTQQTNVPGTNVMKVPKLWIIPSRNNWKFPTSVIPKQLREKNARPQTFSQCFISLFSWMYLRTAIINPRNAARFMTSLKTKLAGGKFPAILMKGAYKDLDPFLLLYWELRGTIFSSATATKYTIHSPAAVKTEKIRGRRAHRLHLHILSPILLESVTCADLVHSLGVKEAANSSTQQLNSGGAPSVSCCLLAPPLFYLVSAVWVGGGFLLDTLQHTMFIFLTAVRFHFGAF